MSSSSVCSSTSLIHSRDTLIALDPDRKYTILTCHTEEYAERFLVKHFPRDLALLIARYVVDGQVMDRQGWQKVYGVDIGEEADRMMLDLGFDLDFERFYAFYHGPNPVDVVEGRNPIRQVCESSLIPTIVPKSVMVEGRAHEYNLTLLGELAEYEGINGHRAKYFQQSDALRQHGASGVDRAHLVILLKGVVARDKSWANQVQYLRDLRTRTGYECEIGPGILSQNTALMAHHAVTGERPFGDESGIEERWTYGRTVELVDNTYHVVSGGFSAGAIGPLGGCAPAALDVSGDDFDDEHDGVGVLRKFEAIGTRNIGARNKDIVSLFFGNVAARRAADCLIQ